MTAGLEVYALAAAVTRSTGGAYFLVIVGAVGAAVVTGVVTWVVSHRLNSGNINTSAAADLWRASESIREDLRNETVSLRGDLASVQEKLAAAEERATKAETETTYWRAQATAMQEEATRTHRQIATLQRQVRELRAKSRKR